MATEEEVEQAVEALQEAIDEVANDSARFSQQQSIEIFEGIVTHAQTWIRSIEADIERDAEEVEEDDDDGEEG